MLIRNQKLLLTFFAASVGIFLTESLNHLPSQSAILSRPLIQRQFRGTSIEKDTYHPNVKILFSQGSENKALMKDKKILEKEDRKEEKVSEKEEKKDCNIAYSKKEGQKKKCEPSVEDSLYPGISNIEATDEESSRMVEELQKDIKDKSIKNIIVK